MIIALSEEKTVLEFVNTMICVFSDPKEKKLDFCGIGDVTYPSKLMSLKPLQPKLGKIHRFKKELLKGKIERLPIFKRYVKGKKKYGICNVSMGVSHFDN